MGSVELMGWIACVAGALFPVSWIPAAIVAGRDERKRELAAWARGEDLA